MTLLMDLPSRDDDDNMMSDVTEFPLRSIDDGFCFPFSLCLRPKIEMVGCGALSLITLKLKRDLLMKEVGTNFHEEEIWSLCV